MSGNSKALSYLNFSDGYERKARFMPSVLAVCTFIPAAMVLSLPLLGWVAAMVTGVGVAAVVSVGLSHLASAMGNRFSVIQQVLAVIRSVDNHGVCQVNRFEQGLEEMIN